MLRADVGTTAAGPEHSGNVLAPCEGEILPCTVSEGVLVMGRERSGGNVVTVWRTCISWRHGSLHGSIHLLMVSVSIWLLRNTILQNELTSLH